MKIGDKVIMVNCAEARLYPNKIWTVSSDPWEICGTMCVLLEGKRGGFSVECLKSVESEALMNPKQQRDADECEKMDAEGVSKDCDTCSCRVCLVQEAKPLHKTTTVNCGVIICMYNADKQCTKETITLYTGAMVECHDCGESFEHDLVDCADYEKKKVDL